MFTNGLLRFLIKFTKTLPGAIALAMSSFLLIIGIATTRATAQSSTYGSIPASAWTQIQVFEQEKLKRTPAQQKIDSHILYAIKALRGDAIFQQVPNFKISVEVFAGDKMRLDIQTVKGVSPQLLAQIQATGSQVLSSFPQYNTLQALVPLSQIEYIAALSEVKHIRRYTPPQLDGSLSSEEVEQLTINEPSQASDGEQVRSHRTTSQIREHLAQVPAPTTKFEGDIAHGAALARSTYGVDGSWLQPNPAGGTIRQRVKIGVLSDSYNNLGGATADIARGELPPDGVTLVGTGDTPSGGTDEGRAMLQIIHSLAPGAQLFFATAEGGEATFASNIKALRAAGCDIIVDDVNYATEPIFQDGIVAQAVNEVTTNGALYFSSAGNSGNLNDGTSGVWEGDFIDGGSSPYGRGGRIHRFTNGTGGLSNPITRATGGLGMILQWSDPWGSSRNDYDLYVLDASGALVDASTNTQNGNGNPYEQASSQFGVAGNQVVVVLYSGVQRYLQLNANRGRLQYNTRGQTGRHSAALNAFSVAAVSAEGRTTLFTGGAANPVETFSSDGPRRIFYRADGSSINWGTPLSTGGIVRQKPDIAAADNVNTSVPGFAPFAGTSAAAPHAAAVAALLKSFRPALSAAQIRSILISTALDIEAPGVDQDSGYGLVMANLALQRVAQIP